jgi:hypothetical protein
MVPTMRVEVMKLVEFVEYGWSFVLGRPCVRLQATEGDEEICIACRDIAHAKAIAEALSVTDNMDPGERYCDG